MQRGSRPAQAKEKQEKANLEAGFTNYFSGANRDRALQKDKELRDRSKSRSVQKKVDDRQKRGWHDRGHPLQDYSSKNLVRGSADRYSEHSEEEETDTHNKVDFNR